MRELQGTPCIAFEDAPAPRQQIASTGSFGAPVRELEPLIQAVTEFATRAAEKLRRQQSHAGQVMFFVRTSPFRKRDAQYSRSMVVPLRRPCADTAAIVGAAIQGLRAIYQPGFNLAKAGVMLVDLQPATEGQLELRLEDDEPERDRAWLMQALDVINDRWGKGTMRMGSAKARRTPAATGRRSRSGARRLTPPNGRQCPSRGHEAAPTIYPAPQRATHKGGCMTKEMVLVLMSAVAVSIVAAVLKGGRGRQASGDVRPKKLLTEREQAMFYTLQQAFPNEVVLGQVAFSALLTAKYQPTRSTFNRKVADFVVATKCLRCWRSSNWTTPATRGVRSRTASATRFWSEPATASSGSRMCRTLMTCSGRCARPRRCTAKPQHNHDPPHRQSRPASGAEASRLVQPADPGRRHGLARRDPP